MIGGQAGVEGEAGERGEAGVRPSPGVSTRTWLVVVEGVIPSWKTKHRLSRFMFPIPSSPHCYSHLL